jgi:hypothetical protein
VAAAGDAPRLIQSFEGVPNIQQVSPPDPVGDVGPNHYVEMVNSNAIQGDGKSGPQPAHSRLSMEDRFCGAPVARITRIR